MLAWGLPQPIVATSGSVRTARAIRAERLAVVALAATLLGGCYLSHRRGDRVRSDGGRELDSGQADASVPLIDASDEPCRGRWRVTSEQQLTDAPGDERLGDAEWTGSGYLVGFHGPAPDSIPSAQLVTFDAAPADPHGVFGPVPRSGWFMAIDIAVSGDGVAALESSSRGCFFRSIARDGSSSSAERRIDARECRALTGMRTGFYLLDNPYLPLDPEGGVRFQHLDADGVPSASLPWLEIFGNYYRGHASVVFEDDSQLLVVQRDEGADLRSAGAQRVDAEGMPLGAETSLPAIAQFANVQAVATPEGVLIGWFHDEGGDPESPERVIRLMRATRDGGVIGEAFTLPDVRAHRNAGWSMTRPEHEIIVVYAELAPGDRTGRETVIRAQALDDLGAPRGAPLSVADATLAEHVIARTNGSNVFVGYSAETTPSRELFAVRLECVDAL